MNKDFDLIIIGAGPGGYETALAAAASGLKTALVERRALGGTCLNEGCIPTKCLCRSAEMLQSIQSDAAAFGIEVASAAFNLGNAVKRTNGVIEHLRNGISQLIARSSNITYIEGDAHFVDKHTVVVAGQSDETLTAPAIIIATGSTTRSLPIPGATLPGVLSSSEVLQLTTVPSRLCVIGGGVIGLEFASIFNTFGSQVTVLEYAPEILPAFDDDMARRLRMALKKQGVSCITKARVSAIETTGNGTALAVSYVDKTGTGNTVEAEIALMAVGRAPNTNGLNVEAAGFNVTPRGIAVNDDMETDVPGIYAIGDVNGRCMLAHAATAQGKRALQHILAKTGQPATEAIPVADAPIPGAVFTHPELASVGMTEEQCKSASINYKVGKAMFAANGKACAMGQGEGIAKLMWDKVSGRLLGAHVLGPHAADLIHEITTLLTQAATIDAVKKTVHAHPTLSEIWLAAAE